MTLTDFGVTRDEATLPNGARVVLFERLGMPLALRVSFLSGSRFDPPNKEGLAHFAEHMIVAGTKSFPTKDKLATYIEELGGVFSAFTGPDVMGVNVGLGDPQDFPHAVRLLREILCKPLLRPKTIETERGSILNELRGKESNPARYVWELFRKLFFQGTAVGRSNLGSIESINSITREDLLSYVQDMLTSGRMGVTISGGIGISRITEKLRKGLPVTVSSNYVPSKTLPILRERNISVKHYPKEQVHLVVGFRTCSQFHEDKVALNILATILGGGRASVLSRKLRYERGLVYGVGAASFGSNDSGTWTIKTSTSKDTVQEVLDIITEEFSRAAEGKITSQELEFVKNKTVKSMKLKTQTSGSWVASHSFGELVNPNKYLRLDQYLNKVAALSLEDLSRVGKRYFVSGKWYLAMCGPLSEEDVTVSF